MNKGEAHGASRIHDALPDRFLRMLSPGRIFSLLLELVYPEACALCDRWCGGTPWAARGARVPGLRPWDRPHLCGDCAGRIAGELVHGWLGDGGARLKVLAPAPVSRGLVQLIGAFKYHGVRGLAWPLAEAMARSSPSGPACQSGGMLVPVPLHRSRRRQRGYNQAEILAELLGRHWGWPVRSDLLVRTRATDQQAKLDDPRDRARNLRGAFRSVCGPGPGEPDTIFLVDDLITSGATVLAASGALASKGWIVAAGLAVGLARQDD